MADANPTPAIGAEGVTRNVYVPKEVSERKDVYVRQSSGLVRSVGPRTALFANLVAMGIVVNYFWIVFASAGYPNANLVTTVGIGVLINVGIGYVYWMLSSAMPRSGGDYVFMGRIFHPSIGLAVNLVFTVVFVSWAGYFAYYCAVYGFPILFASYAVAGGPASATALSWAGTLSTSTGAQIAVGGAFLAAVVLISFLPTKWIFRTTVGIFAVTAVIYVVMMGVMLTHTSAQFESAWNAHNPASQTYAAIVASAASTSTITFAGTFLGVVYTMLSFIGYANSSYFAGEIRGNPTRTQGLAIFGAPLIFAALIAGLYAETYNLFGRTFLIGLSQGYLSGTVSTAGFPSPLYLAAYLAGNPYLAAFLALGILLTFFGFSLIYFILPTRNLFAWSFDRILPSFFARVSRRGVPYVAVATLAVASAIVLYIGVYTTFFSYLSYSNFGFWFAVGIVCLGAALFPFLRPRLYGQAPAIVRARVGKVPILSIVGFVCAGAAWFVSYAASTAQYVEPSGAYNYDYLIFLPVVFVIGLVVYWIAYALQKHRGVPVDLIAKELPPD
ncbi:MAG: APC family permease [Thermoplasmatales archaeon]|nr:APC family permease [Thermoplasmatales archaeon]